MSHRSSLSFFIRLAVVLAISQFASGATYYVATTGNDTNPGTAAQPWATIQKAVDTIASGDVIIVKNGTYTGARIESSGQDGLPKTLKAENKWGVLLNVVHPTRAKHNGILELERFAGEGVPISYWVVDGFEVDGHNEHRCVGVWGQGPSAPAHHNTVRNCHIHHAQGKVSPYTVSTGLFDGYHSYASYENNVTHHNTEHGIYHSNSSDYATISGNISHSNNGCGYHNNGDLAAGAPGAIRYVLYEKNTAYANGSTGGGAINCSGEHFSVYRNNLLYSNLASGFTFYMGGSAAGSHDNKIYNNTVVMPSNGRFAALLDEFATNNKFFNNILLNAHPFKGSFTIGQPNQTGFQSDYNVVTPDRFNTDGEGSEPLVTINLTAWRALGYDTHSIVATPAELFVNAAGGDYHLKAGSPAIDAGTDLSSDGVTDDFESRARPVGSTYDIGCYEYSGLPMVAKPVFAPTAGTYFPSVDVTITCATGTATIYYTTNGADPTQSSNVYSSPVNIASTTTLKARAFAASMDPSGVATGFYGIGYELVLQEGTAGYAGWEDTWISPDFATTPMYAEEIFHIQTGTPDRQLHRFDITGKIPAGMKVTSALLYLYHQSAPTGAATVSSYRVIKHWVEAQATYNKATNTVNWGVAGMQSGVDYDAAVIGTSPPVTSGDSFAVDITGAVDGWYKASFPNEGVVLIGGASGHLKTYSTKTGITAKRPKVVILYEPAIQRVATPTFDPLPGSYVGYVDVSMACATADAEIRYTTDGNDPTDTSNLYTAPVHLTTTTVLKARGFKSGMTESLVASGTYELSGTIATPTFSPAAGSYGAAIDVTISCVSNGVTIHYTVNGDTPTASSTTYTSPIHITTYTTVKAIATKASVPDSAVAVAFYRIDAQAPSISGLATVPTYVRAGIDASITLTASATDAATGGSNITAAECFEGVDPGAGRGTAMSALDGSFNSATESLTVTLNCSSWTPPTPRRLYARARDAAGHWSSVQSILVSVVSAVPPGAVTDLTVVPGAAYTKAPLGVAGVSSTSPGWLPAALVDGSFAVSWTSDTTLTRDDQWVIVDLGDVEEIAAVALVPAKPASFFPIHFTIAVSEDQTDWTVVGRAVNFKPSGAVRFIWQFDPVEARYVRIMGPGVYDRRNGEYLWQIAEVEVPTSLTATLATLKWTAPADDGYTGSKATSYEVRFSESPISAASFAAADEIPVGIPSDPGVVESFPVDFGDVVGRVFVAMKTSDTMGNWSALSNVWTNRVGGVRLAGTFPPDGSMLNSGTTPVFFFGVGDAIKTSALFVSSSPGFPPRPFPRPGGGIDVSVRAGLKAGAGSWKPSVGQWKAIKKIVPFDGVIHWRLEGKAVIVDGAAKVATLLYGPTRSAYFDIGTINGLTVSPSHEVDGKDAVWPLVAQPPAFSWTSLSPTSVKFFVDVSLLPDVSLSDKKSTMTLTKKPVSATSYQASAADWKKIRTLARRGSLLYWRVRGVDGDGLLGCGSAPKPLIIDGGEWALSGPASLLTSPCEFSWTTTAAANGLVAYNIQISAQDDFEPKARITVNVPARPIAAFSYSLSDREKTVLQNLAAKNGVTTLYWRVRGIDAEKAFTAFSPSQTVDIQ